MPKAQLKGLSGREEKAMLNSLSEPLARLHTKDDVAHFLSKVLTRNEIVMVARRAQIASLLLSGKSYAEIQEETHSGTSTIARVQTWLNDEDQQCSEATMKVLREEAQRRLHKKRTRPVITSEALNDLKRRHPVRFMLLGLFD